MDEEIKNILNTDERKESLLGNYKSAYDKVSYFSKLENKDKQLLFDTLTRSEQKQLIALLPLSYLKILIDISQKEVQKDIIKLLSPNQLKAIYNTSNEMEKLHFENLLEDSQIDLLKQQDNYQHAINENINNINISNNNIINNTNDIIQNKAALAMKKNELKDKNKIIKKVNKERAKKLKSLLKAQKNLTKKSSRIAIISKYRMNKYHEKISELNDIEMVLNSERASKVGIEQEITMINNNINSLEDKVAKEKQNIQNYQRKINSNTRYLRETEIKIKRLSQSEKKLLGRKLYNQKLEERDAIIVRQKKSDLIQEQNRKENSETTQAIKQAEKTSIEEKTVSNVAPPKVDNNASKVAASKPDDNTKESLKTETVVASLTDAFNILSKMGVSFPNSQANINQNQSPATIENEPISKISATDAIIISYTMAALSYAMMLQKVQQENLSNEKGYTKVKAAGFINMGTLLAIILFICNLILFIIR